MNFFAHALHCLDDPYRTAGVALPDWLTVVRPRVRCRSRQALPHVEAGPPERQAVARGVVRHHEDDAWFHQTQAFVMLSLAFAKRIRKVTDDVDGARPSFVGHILVELLLDAELIVEHPQLIDRYYQSIEHLDASAVVQHVSVMIDAPADDIGRVIARFASERFLYDYASDERLCFRLNQVMKRVGLPQLPESFSELLPQAREDVKNNRDALLPHARCAPASA